MGDIRSYYSSNYPAATVLDYGTYVHVYNVTVDYWAYMGDNQWVSVYYLTAHLS